MTTVDFGITFGKKSFKVTLGKEKTLRDLKNEIHRVTGVGPAQQKLVGLLPPGKNIRDISDDTPLGDGLVMGQKWKKPRHKVVLFEESEEEIAKRRDEEQKVIQKTQALRDSFEVAEAREKAAEEEYRRRLAQMLRESGEFYRYDSELSLKKMRTFDDGLPSGFMGDPLPGFGNSPAAPPPASPLQNGATVTTLSGRCLNINIGGNGEQRNNGDDASLLTNTGSDMSAKISASLYMYSSVMAESQGDLLDISGKIVLPRSILDETVEKRVHLPLAFKIEGVGLTGETPRTVLGVMDFKAPEEVAFLPRWVIEKLNIEEGMKLNIESVNPPKGYSVVFKPLCPESVLRKYGNIQPLLENHLQRYQFLTVGDRIQVPLEEGNVVQFEVTELRENKDTKVESITTIDSDIITDFDYEDEDDDDNKMDVEGCDDDDDDDDNYVETHLSDTYVDEKYTFSIPKGKSRYLKIICNDNNTKNEPIIVVTKPVIGDPDIYVSLSYENKYPDRTNYDLCDQTEGVRTLRIENPPRVMYVCARSFNGKNSRFSVIAFRESNSELEEKHCGKKLSDGAAPVSSENYAPCSFCGQMIQKCGMRLHELRCRRLNFKCGICGAVIRTGNKEKHMSLVHTKIMCQCGVELEQEPFQVHRRSECPLRMVVCAYCGITLRGNAIDEHQALCGSKSFTCAHCNKNILRKDFCKHLSEVHGIEKMDQQKDIK